MRDLQAVLANTETVPSGTVIFWIEYSAGFARHVEVASSVKGQPSRKGRHGEHSEIRSPRGVHLDCVSLVIRLVDTVRSRRHWIDSLGGRWT
jgi:hypothetical protein